MVKWKCINLKSLPKVNISVWKTPTWCWPVRLLKDKKHKSKVELSTISFLTWFFKAVGPETWLICNGIAIVFLHIFPNFSCFSQRSKERNPPNEDRERRITKAYNIGERAKAWSRTLDSYCGLSSWPYWILHIIL